MDIEAKNPAHTVHAAEITARNICSPITVKSIASFSIAMKRTMTTAYDPLQLPIEAAFLFATEVL